MSGFSVVEADYVQLKLFMGDIRPRKVAAPSAPFRTNATVLDKSPYRSLRLEKANGRRKVEGERVCGSDAIVVLSSSS